MDAYHFENAAESDAANGASVSTAYDAEIDARLTFARRTGPTALVYAALFAICLYRNERGLTASLFFVATALLLFRVLRAAKKDVRAEGYFALALIAALGVSLFFTDNDVVIALNYVAVFSLTVGALLYHFADVTSYALTDYAIELCRATFGALTRIPAMCADLYTLVVHKKETQARGVSQIFVGLLVGVPLALFLCAELSTADAVFRNLLNRVYAALVMPEEAIEICAMFVFAFFACYCGLRYFHDARVRYHRPMQRRFPATGAVVAGAMIAIVYLIFSVIQISYLFIGRMSLPYGYTYAQYAREGFFQLLFVCALNLALVLFANRRFEASRALRIVLLTVSACTYVMLASSALRMVMYVRAYRLTFLRVSVFVALFTLAILFFGVVRMIFKPFDFFRYGVAVVGAVYALFAFSHVDYFIAGYNLAHIAEDTGAALHSDYYLSALSKDAAPVLARYEAEREKRDGWYEDYLYRQRLSVYDQDAFSIRTFNLSREAARRATR